LKNQVLNLKKIKNSFLNLFSSTKTGKKKNTRSLKTPFETIKQPPIPLKIIK
jgi:zona occludens toxin (predicted ATPase)